MMVSRVHGLAVAAMALSLVLVGMPTRADVPVLDSSRGVMTMAPLLDRTTPAVVNISVRTKLPADENPLFRDPFFRRFFDIPERSPERGSMSAGSGVIVDAKKGYVLTNQHVVDNADEIIVTLKDQRRFKAKLIGGDPGTDIALLEIEPDNLSALPLGDSDTIKVGDLVVAIGNPFGLGQTVTSGIVSALGRTGIASEKYEDFIQTDAPINPGNSGGALVSSKGELIGINTAIIAPGGGNVGIGFAVPSNMAKQVMDHLVRFGEVRRGRMGVAIQDLTPDLAVALDIKGERGAVVGSVEKGSPADGAGLQPGDVIVAVDGKRVASSADLRNRIGLVVRGTTVELEFLRKGERRTARVEVASPKTALLTGSESLPQFEGALITDIPPQHPASGKIEGVLVAQVGPGSPAWQNGLREGDLIVGANQRTIGSVEALKSTAQASDGVLALNILRGGLQLFLVIR